MREGDTSVHMQIAGQSIKSTFLQQQAPVFNLSTCVCRAVIIPPPLSSSSSFSSVSHLQWYLTEQEASEKCSYLLHGQRNLRR